jgi:pectate lyase
VLIQHLRIRVGDSPDGPSPSNRDALQILGPNAYNVVVDHISASWAIDENVSTWYPLQDITISNSIISEGLHRSLHGKGPHSMGFLVGDHSRNVAIIGNLFAHNNERNPLLKGGTSALIANNLMYNTGPYGFIGFADDGKAGPSQASIIGNVFIDGGNRTRAAISVAINISAGTRIYKEDNQYAGKTYSGPQGVIAETPLVWCSPFPILPATDVEAHVLAYSGARPSERDDIDKRIVKEVQTRTGEIIDSPTQVGGWPDLPQTFRQFEIPEEPNADEKGNGYTAIEEILHRMAAQVEGR